MGQRIEAYVEQIVSRLICSKKEREEIKAEMLDHLFMLKKDFIENGQSEERAIDSAIQAFGDEREISKRFGKLMFPNKNIGKILAIILGCFMLFVMFNQPISSGVLFSFLFFLLLISSIMSFLLAWYIKSWESMLLSGILLFPVTWFLSGYPSLPWALYIPVIHLVLAIIIYQTNKMKWKISNKNNRVNE